MPVTKASSSPKTISEGPATKYLRDLIGRFPQAPALTLAKTAYRERPECWRDVETCRAAVRRILGTFGKKNRQKVKDKTLFREPRTAGWSDVIPEALVQLPDWKALQIDGPHRTLILNDLHFPYHDPQALEVALEYGFKRNPSLIVINGDIGDHYQLSQWEKDPKARDFAGEVRATRQFKSGLRRRAGRKCRIIFKQGNHDERLERYMRIKAPELLGLDCLKWENLYELAEDNIEFVGDKRPLKLNELNVIHGHEYRFNISNPVNPARGLFLRGKTHAICGHFHQSSSHSEKNLDGKVVSTWSVGCLCDLHPAYAPLNQWNHGFAFIEIGKQTGFQVENNKIIGGKVW